MGRNRRWVAALLLVAGFVVLAGVCVQQCEASASQNSADGKRIFSDGEKDVQQDEDADLSFLDDEEAAEKKQAKEERLKKLAEEEAEEEEEDDDDDDDEEEEVEADDDIEGEDFQGDSALDEAGEDEEEEEEEVKEADEKDVVVIGSGNFSEVLKANHYVMVEFYAPWCGHCQALAPEYAEAATLLKDVAVLAKVDATLEDDLAQKFDIEGYPTLIFFIDGVQKPYSGQRQRDAIVEWVKKKTGPSVITITSKDDAELIVDTQKTTMAIAYLEDLKGADAQTYSAVARQDDDVVFYQTDNKEVAEAFTFSKEAKRPSLVLLKQEAEKVSWFDGSFERDELVRFVAENKLPLVITFNKESSALIFESPIKRQFLLFADQDELERVLPEFKVVSKAFTGKMVFVHVDLGDTEQAPGITEFFGIPSDKPAVVAFESHENGRKFLMEGEINVENMKTFADGFLKEKLRPHLKSDPIPESNDGPVKIVVGKNLDDIVLDETTDCFLEIYAPWCGHCQALESTWTKLAKRLQSVKSIVIAKMDGTTNEHARAKSDGYPTLLFFPAGKKSFDPITFDGDRTLKDFVKFLKKEAAIPFTVPKKPATVIEDVTATSKIAEPSNTASATTESKSESGIGSVTESDASVVNEPQCTKESMCESDNTAPATKEAESTLEAVTESVTNIPEKIQHVIKDSADSMKDEL
ncbi:protein disulfide-isomerase A1 [Marchantia polymorpha subsp. ruderalis]|uniref:protein disulfide-isomerase n=2 Tax=Marchantia polymorpha TaxID=3197 RepID=A0AAF6BFW2_MARPO|nr:hypothetical protein MARPO_0127s0051 [Marchantia polymorpha]BBN10896.1 hypothetical protein Mp_5g07350 [Marchantia polymorpha subsp. ruderalis]|eukprot:PTQ30270.1 hypothetical protein MARPO_0127s0051 [Marchantia polymorpha]